MKPLSQRAQVFQKNALLERLTRTSPQLILGIDLPLVALFLAIYLVQGNPVWKSLVYLLSGFFAWTLAEYLLHRYVFHWVTDNRWVQRFHYFAHGFHHNHPRDRDHLFMPPPVNLALITLFWGLFYLVLDVHVYAFLPGFLLGYLTYTLLHYAMHTVPNPPKFLRPLWRHHHLHHSKFTDRAYGVSSTLWDRVFGTLPRERPAKAA